VAAAAIISRRKLLAPAARDRTRQTRRFPGLADSPWATHLRPLRGLQQTKKFVGRPISA